MINELEKEANALWCDYNDDNVFWDQYNSTITKAKALHSTQLLLTKDKSQHKFHNTPVALSVAEAYQQLPFYDYKISTTNYGNSGNVSYKKMLDSSFFVAFAINIPFILAILIGIDDKAEASLGLLASFLFFFITIFIVRVAWISLAPESVDEYVYITFEKDYLSYRTGYTDPSEVIMYESIAQVDWQEKGKIVITEDIVHTTHTLAYPINDPMQAQAIKNLLMAAKQNNIMNNLLDYID